MKRHTYIDTENDTQSNVYTQWYYSTNTKRKNIYAKFRKEKCRKRQAESNLATWGQAKSEMSLS